jgi:hypothetical protein
MATTVKQQLVPVVSGEALPAEMAWERAVLAELRAIRAVLEQRQRPVVPLSRADRALLGRMLPALAGAFGSETFSARDLAEDERPAVRIVVQERTVKQLAQLFAKADGLPIEGLKLECHGLEERVTVWRIIAV